MHKSEGMAPSSLIPGLFACLRMHTIFHKSQENNLVHVARHRNNAHARRV